MGTEAVGGVKARGFAAVDGDQGVLAPPPGVSKSLDFRYRLESVEAQLLNGATLDLRDRLGPVTRMGGQSQGFHPTLCAGVQRCPVVGVDPELASRPDHEPVGHRDATAACREPPSAHGRAFGHIGFQNPRAALVCGGRGQSDAAPALLEGHGPVDLRRWYPML
jgi:hypothetical protein